MSLKKLIVFILIVVPLAYSVIAEGSCPDENRDLRVLDAAEQSFDVLGAYPMLLGIETKGEQAPEAEVTAEYAGFECQVEKVVQVSKGCFEIAVNWSPGADVSGCTVLVKDPNSGNSKEAHLYMNY